MSVALADAFGTQSPLELAKRFEGFKTALQAEWAKTAAGETRLNDGWHRTDEGKIAASGRLIEKVDLADMVGNFSSDPLIRKALSADALSSIQSQITAYRAAQADLVKDITSTSPLASGLVPFDLEAPTSLWAAA